MKLQSTTDFVLAESKHGVFKYTNTQIRDYANFLKQSLNKGMFVPCDLRGNVLEKPKEHEAIMNSSDLLRIGSRRIQLSFNYEDAKERVLFKDIALIRNSENFFIIEPRKGFMFYRILKNNTTATIEDLLKLKVDIELTESAIKQFM